jgi:hypothetical protein
MASSPPLFETIACPLCGAREYVVVRRSSYPASITAKELGHMYSASSAHVLMDQVVECNSWSLEYVNPRPDPEIGSIPSAWNQAAGWPIMDAALMALIYARAF